MSRPKRRAVDFPRIDSPYCSSAIEYHLREVFQKLGISPRRRLRTIGRP